MIRRLWPLLLLALAAFSNNAGDLSNPKFSMSIGAEQRTALALGNAAYNASLSSLTTNYTYGTGAGAVNLAWTDTSTVPASGADTVRLRGTITDPFGNVISFGHIKALVIVCKATNTNDVIIGGAADSAWVGPFGSGTHTHSCKPGESYGFGMLNTGYTVSDAIKKLKIGNGGAGTPVFYTIMMLGTTT